MRKNITKINWLAYISYSGQDFSPPRVASDVSNLNESKKSLNSPEPFIKRCLQPVFERSEQIQVKSSVRTVDGANALMNAVSIRLETDTQKQIGDLNRLGNILNSKLFTSKSSLKFLKIHRVPDLFCARDSSTTCDFKFRFTTTKADLINVFEYPVLSSVDIPQFQMEQLQERLDLLNKSFESHKYDIFSHEENFLRRKFTIPAMSINLDTSNNHFLGNRTRFHSDPVWILKIANYPVSADLKISQFLSLLLSNAASRTQLDQLSSLLKSDTSTSSSDSTHIFNLNGLFLDNLSFSQKF